MGYVYFVEYFEDGKTVYKEGFRITNGNRTSLEGPYREYYENGSLHKETTYYQGYKDGLYKLYDKQENLTLECYYEEGLMEGPYKEYNDNLTPSIIANIRDDFPIGSYKIYDRDGKLEEELYFNEDGERTKIFPVE